MVEKKSQFCIFCGLSCTNLSTLTNECCQSLWQQLGFKTFKPNFLVHFFLLIFKLQGSYFQGLIFLLSFVSCFGLLETFQQQSCALHHLQVSSCWPVLLTTNVWMKTIQVIILIFKAHLGPLAKQLWSLVHIWLCIFQFAGNQVLSVSTDASDSGFKTNSPQLTNHVVQNGNVKRSEKNEDCRLQLYPSQIKIASAKLALNSGKEHFTTKGKLKKARSLKPPCKSSCKRCEVPKITESDRREISSEFWGLGDHVKQWKYINDSISSTAPRTKTSISGAKGEKLSSRTYYLTVNGKKMKVCKTMFRSTLSICDSWVTSALSHFVNGNVSRDKRGRKPLLVKSSLAWQLKHNQLW